MIEYRIDQEILGRHNNLVMFSIFFIFFEVKLFLTSTVHNKNVFQEMEFNNSTGTDNKQIC